jgi:hypothetical protein
MDTCQADSYQASRSLQMSQTHFWRRPTELPAKTFRTAVTDIERVLASLDIELAGFEGHGAPIFKPDVVVFNGTNRASCEPFEIHQTEFDRRGRPDTFSFCKTQGLPYDLAVKIALVTLKLHFGTQLIVTSDQPNSAWSKARDIVAKAVRSDFEFRLDSSG